jgi:hypothetical protein
MVICGSEIVMSSAHSPSTTWPMCPWKVTPPVAATAAVRAASGSSSTVPVAPDQVKGLAGEPVALPVVWISPAAMGPLM